MGGDRRLAGQPLPALQRDCSEPPSISTHVSDGCATKASAAARAPIRDRRGAPSRRSDQRARGPEEHGSDPAREPREHGDSAADSLSRTRPREWPARLCLGAPEAIASSRTRADGRPRSHRRPGSPIEPLPSQMYRVRLRAKAVGQERVQLRHVLLASTPEVRHASGPHVSSEGRPHVKRVQGS